MNAMTLRYAIAARLEPPSEATPINPAVLADLLWAHARPADLLDHVRTAPDQDGAITIVLLLRADTESAAIQAATRLCTYALCTHALAAYRVADMGVLPLADVTTTP